MSFRKYYIIVVVHLDDFLLERAKIDSKFYKKSQQGNNCVLYFVVLPYTLYYFRIHQVSNNFPLRFHITVYLEKLLNILMVFYVFHHISYVPLYLRRTEVCCLPRIFVHMSLPAVNKKSFVNKSIMKKYHLMTVVRIDIGI